MGVHDDVALGIRIRLLLEKSDEAVRNSREILRVANTRPALAAEPDPSVATR